MIAISKETKTKILNTPIYEGMFFSITLKDKCRAIQESSIASADRNGFAVYTYNKRVPKLFFFNNEELQIHVKLDDIFKYNDEDIDYVGEYIYRNHNEIEKYCAEVIYDLYKKNKSKWSPKLKRFLRRFETGDAYRLHEIMNDFNAGTLVELELIGSPYTQIEYGEACMIITTPWDSIIGIPICDVKRRKTVHDKSYIMYRR